MKPRLFVASSTESLDVAYAVQENLDHEMEVTVWTQGIFSLGRTPLDSLYRMTERVDAAAFVFSLEDEAFVRGKMKPAVRDNVVFELGMFVGALSADRCFILKPRSFSALSFPTDLMGIEPADYDDARADGNTVAALGVACNRIRRAIKDRKGASKIARNDGVPANVSGVESSPKELEKVVTGGLFRLYFNPPRYKHIRFEEGGMISEGKNDNEASWRIDGDELVLVQSDGRIHNTFAFAGNTVRFTSSGESRKGIAGQYIIAADEP